jgi:hypothetical protein
MLLVIEEYHAPYPGGGENIPSLLYGNVRVINKLKTVKAICRSQVDTV